MLTPESELDWTKPVPQVEVDLEELEDDHYGFVQNGEPFSGIAVSRYPNGEMESRRPCLNGMPHGLCRWWHENGQLSAEWTAFLGMGHGWATEWHENGQVANRTYAEFGRPLEWKKFDLQGHETEQGSNREDKNTLLWIERYRKRFPDAP